MPQENPFRESGGVPEPENFSAPHQGDDAVGRHFEGDHWTLESRLSVAADVGQEVERRLSDAGWTYEEIDQFDVAVDEAVANAIIHGNWGIEKNQFNNDEDVYKAAYEKRDREDPGDMKIVVDVSISDREAAVTVRWETPREFNPSSIPDSTAPENLEKSTGRGVDIVNRSTDIEYSPTSVRLTKFRAVPPEGGGFVNIKDFRLEQEQ